MGRPKGWRKYKDGEQTCRKCDVNLVVGDNWRIVNKNNGDYKCNKCYYNISKQWRLDNPEANLKSQHKHHRREGIGLYQVMLGEICMYVGEGILASRKRNHLKDCQHKVSPVYTYCLKHNINRKLLSFNVLEYEDDIARRKQIEDWYITFLTPVINPKPPLGLYV